jgi:arylsulfatase
MAQKPNKLIQLVATLLCMFVTAAAQAAGSASASPIAQQRKNPNILLIVADDMGYSDLGCFGGEIGRGCSKH